MTIALRHTIRSILEPQRTLAWSADGDVLVTAGSRWISVWDPNSGRIVRSIDCGDITPAIHAAPNRRRVAAHLASGAIGLWSLETGGQIPISCEPMFASCVTWSPNGEYVAAVSKTGITGIWESYIGAPMVRLNVPNPPTTLAWAPNSQSIASADPTGAISIWNLKGGLRRRLNDVPGGGLSLAWSHDGRRIYSGGADQIIRIWNADSGALEQILEKHDNTIVAISTSSLANHVASKSIDGTVRVWDCDTRKEKERFDEAADDKAGITLAFSPDGRSIASLDTANGEISLRSIDEKAGVKERKLLFISYCQADKFWLDKLKLYLKPLEREGLIETWEDTKLEAGQLWRDEINDKLARAKVAVLLVTQAYLASDFIMNQEIPVFFDRAKNDGLKIIWIAVKHIGEPDARINNYQAANDRKRPLQSLSGDKRDEQLAKIAGLIRAAMVP